MAGELCQTKSRAGISATGFFYSDIPLGNPSIQSHLVHQIPGYVSNSEMFNTSTGVDQMIGFAKNMEQQSNDGNTAMWKSFNGKSGSQPGPSTSRLMPDSTADYYHYHDQFNKDNQFATAVISEPNTQNLIVGPHDNATWQAKRVDDHSSMRYVFPCERNERTNRGGLSLSLRSSNPTSMGLQSVRIGHANHHQDQQDAVSSIFRDHQGLYEKSGNTQQQQQMLKQLDWFVGKAVTNANIQGQCFLKNSKYLIPAQELLSEFCSIATNQTDQQKQKLHKSKQLDEGNSSVSSRKQSLNSLEFAELQRRKLKLLSMLEEVDRRYRHYCNQMKALVSSFEAMAGKGSATVYSAFASKAMSRHFRCLKDGILNQIKVTRKEMGEKDPDVPCTRGETPRLRAIDQTLRQQRAFQKMSMMERHPWRPQRGLPERAVSVLRAWLFEHFLHPYPNDVDKHILARQTGLSRSQVSNWFINARVRLWKPMVEEMYFEETKEQENKTASSDGFRTDDNDDNCRPIHTHTPPSTQLVDQKPTPDQLVRVDSECLSSVVSNKPDHNNNFRISCDVLPTPHLQSRPHERVGESACGAVEMDFTSYDQPSVSYTTNNANQTFNAGGVSLTLGLHQHGGSGVSSVFAPATQNSMFYPREQMQECHPVQYSILDGETQNLSYRNWMGAQLLPDLAG